MNNFDSYFGKNKSFNKNKKKYRKKRCRRKARPLFITITIFISSLSAFFVFGIYNIYIWIVDNKKTSDITDKIEEITEVVEIDDTPETEIINEEEDRKNPYWYYINFPLIDVDIMELRRQNDETIGWINVNNTNINYPIVHTTNNDYYLNHSFDKSYNDAGWIFLDYRNKKNFSDRNNIIYGHSRLDKTMLGSLSKTLKKDWYLNKDNHIIRLSLENENTLWQIFSVYVIETESYYITTEFTSDEEYIKFLNTIKNRSLYDFNANLGKDDKVLTLSTCYSETERTVVHARLIKKISK